jgi:hypothetical protein
MMASNFGQFAGSFAQAFTGTRAQLEEQQRLKKIAKLQGQLLEQKVLAGEKIQELSEGTIDEFATSTQPDPETGRLPLPEFQGQEPMGLPEMLADPHGQLALVQAGLMNVSDLFGGRTNETLELMGAAGIDPMSEEGREIIRSSITGGDGGGVEELLAQALLQQRTMDIENARREREKNETTERKRVAGAGVDVRNAITAAQEMVTLQKDLEGTALAAGVPYNELIREAQAGGVAALEALGFDFDERKKLIAKFDWLNKLYASGTIEALDRFAGTGAVTSNKFEALIAATPSGDKSASANALLAADHLEAILDAAEIEGIDVPNMQEARQWVAEQRATPAGGTPGETILDLSEVASMSKEQIESIDLTNVGPEAVKAIRKRWDELKNVEL